MELQNMIFHALITKQHSSNVEIYERPEELTLPNENANRLVEEARNSYSKESSVAYAKFDHGWFPDCLFELISENKSFLNFSKDGLKNLKKQMEEQPLTSGGHLFFTRYTENGNSFILVLLLKNIEGFIINKLELSESHILNLDKLHFGARVNIQKWQEDNSTYITFLKGSGRTDVTSYFKKFLCIDDNSFNDPTANTRKLVQAVKDYCHKNIEDENTRYQVRDRISKELNIRIENNESITITAVASLINPEVPQSFIDHINSFDYEIQTDFKVDKPSIKQLTRYSGRTKNLSISFEQSALENQIVSLESEGDGTDKRPILIVREIPQNLVKELKADSYE